MFSSHQFASRCAEYPVSMGSWLVQSKAHYCITDVPRKMLEILRSHLSVKPTVAASAGTKLPMWERKTIKATWKMNCHYALIHDKLYSWDTTLTSNAPPMWPRNIYISTRSPQNKSKFNAVVNTHYGLWCIIYRCFRHMIRILVMEWYYIDGTSLPRLSY